VRPGCGTARATALGNRCIGGRPGEVFTGALALPFGSWGQWGGGLRGKRHKEFFIARASGLVSRSVCKIGGFATRPAKAPKGAAGERGCAHFSPAERRLAATVGTEKINRCIFSRRYAAPAAKLREVCALLLNRLRHGGTAMTRPNGARASGQPKEKNGQRGLLCAKRVCMFRGWSDNLRRRSIAQPARFMKRADRSFSEIRTAIIGPHVAGNRCPHDAHLCIWARSSAAISRSMFFPLMGWNSDSSGTCVPEPGAWKRKMIPPRAAFGRSYS